MTLRVRWLGRVPYREAWALQRALHAHSPDDHLLLLEHPHVYTHGVRADMRHVLVPPADVGADLVRTDRGGDVTYHGPGQLTGYAILSLPAKRGSGKHGLADTVAYVRSVEQLLIDALADVGIDVSLRAVTDAVASRAAAQWGRLRDGEPEVDRQDVVWRHRPDDLSAFSRGEGPGLTISAGARAVGAPPAPPAASSPSRGRA